MAHFASISIEVALLVIRGIPRKTSTFDFVPTSLLKSCADVFGLLLANLVNTSLREGIFPDLFTVGQVMPILIKPGADTADMANYHPITNLNII